MTLLITRPNYDDATSYLYSYAKLVLDFAKEKGIKTIDLVKPRLTKKNLSEILTKQNPLLLFFNAHGDEKKIYGDKIKEEEVLIEENRNHKLLSNRITYARACMAAASLGKAAVKEGGCFIGYTVPFSFWIDERWSSKPLNDKTAGLFLEPSNLIITSLLKGNTAKEASERSLNMSKKNIMGLLKRKKEPGATASIMLLWNNMQGQQILGNGELSFL